MPHLWRCQCKRLSWEARRRSEHQLWARLTLTRNGGAGTNVMGAQIAEVTAVMDRCASAKTANLATTAGSAWGVKIVETAVVMASDHNPPASRHSVTPLLPISTPALSRQRTLPSAWKPKPKRTIGASIGLTPKFVFLVWLMGGDPLQRSCL